MGYNPQLFGTSTVRMHRRRGSGARWARGFQAGRSPQQRWRRRDGVVQERRPANRFPNKGVGRRDKMMAVSVSLGDGALRIVVTMEGTRSGPAAAVQ